MNSISTIEISRCEALVDALRAELGGVVAERVIEAEAADFLWDSRVRERYLGLYCEGLGDFDDQCCDLSRIAVLSLLDGRWYAAICLVDGEGNAVELLWKLQFTRFEEAESAFLHVR